MAAEVGNCGIKGRSQWCACNKQCSNLNDMGGWQQYAKADGLGGDAWEAKKKMNWAWGRDDMHDILSATVLSPPSRCSAVTLKLKRWASQYTHRIWSMILGWREAPLLKTALVVTLSMKITTWESRSKGAQRYRAMRAAKVSFTLICSVVTWGMSASQLRYAQSNGATMPAPVSQASVKR